MRTLYQTVLSFLMATWPISASVCAQDLPKAESNASSKLSRPVRTGILGVKDPAALAELRSHRALVAPGGWLGFKGVGKMTYESDSVPYDANLSADSDGRFRLDSGSKKGTTSVRVDNFVAKLQKPNGGLAHLPLDAAMSGLFPFELARTFQVGDKGASLKDDGVITREGVSLHKVTLERGTLGVDPISKQANSFAMDFYFDPLTHLLVETAAMVPVSGARGLSLLTTVEYSDYRRVGDSLIPFRFVESIEGETSRTLQLSSAEITSAFDSTFFTF